MFLEHVLLIQNDKNYLLATSVLNKKISLVLARRLREEEKQKAKTKPKTNKKTRATITTTKLRGKNDENIKEVKFYHWIYNLGGGSLKKKWPIFASV
jgi:hypothetical protein